jgi:hypothetical protein
MTLKAGHQFLILATALAALFTLLTWPSLVSPAQAASFPGSPLITDETQLRSTPVVTIYVPIVVRPAIPPNSFTITALVFSGGDETVAIKNSGPKPQLLNGWQLVSVVGSQIYDFPDGITLAVGATVRVHSGPTAVDNPPADLFWTTAFIWNNQGDKAELRDDQNQVRASSCYEDGCP